jgi:hypothetical protein
MAFRRTGSACSKLKLVPMKALIPMAPKPGEFTVISANGTVATILAF